MSTYPPDVPQVPDKISSHYDEIGKVLVAFAVRQALQMDHVPGKPVTLSMPLEISFRDSSPPPDRETATPGDMDESKRRVYPPEPVPARICITWNGQACWGDS